MGSDKCLDTARTASTTSCIRDFPRGWQRSFFDVFFWIFPIILDKFCCKNCVHSTQWQGVPQLISTPCNEVSLFGCWLELAASCFHLLLTCPVLENIMNNHYLFSLLLTALQIPTTYGFSCPFSRKKTPIFFSHSSYESCFIPLILLVALHFLVLLRHF